MLLLYNTRLCSVSGPGTNQTLLLDFSHMGSCVVVQVSTRPCCVSPIRGEGYLNNRLCLYCGLMVVLWSRYQPGPAV